LVYEHVIESNPFLEGTEDLELADQGMIILTFLFEVTVSFQKLEAYGVI
jgi:hypothetical protein